jgi:subtilisin family serine protease
MTMQEGKPRPAWSSQFAADAIRNVKLIEPLEALSREWAWGGSMGKGVKVGIVDSGVEHDHPALDSSVKGGVVITWEQDPGKKIRILEDDPPRDYFGHGTACAGIVHALAPEAEIYSIRVLGKDLKAKALQFAAGLQWAIEQGMNVVNLSLSTSKSDYYALFHELTDEAYFKNILLVSAVNNFPVASYPSLYSSVVSVAAGDSEDPMTYFYNPRPPVEFGAPGIDVEVAWLNQGSCVTTGNSFAAPHISGIIALILAKHPDLTPFHVKTILYACASNIQPGVV